MPIKPWLHPAFSLFFISSETFPFSLALTQREQHFESFDVVSDQAADEISVADVSSVLW